MSLYSTSSINDLLNCKSKSSSYNTSTSSSHSVTHSYSLRSRAIQTSSSSSRRSASISISAILRQNAQPDSFSSESLPSSLSDFPVSLRPSFGIETSFTVHSYPISHLIRDQESKSSLSAVNPTDLPYRTLEENSRPPTPDLYHYPVRLDSQMINHPRQDLRYHILRSNRIKLNLPYSSMSGNGELTRLTLTSTELKFEVTVKFIGLYPH